MFQNPTSSSETETFPQSLVLHQPDDGLRQFLGIIFGDQQTCLSILHRLGNSAASRTHNWKPHSLRLDEDYAEALRIT